jgi:maltooligosyltrehalose synthase
MHLPLGADVWRDAVLTLPGEPGQRYADLFTGRTLCAEPHAGRPALRLADVFSDFPVAALLSTVSA